MNQNLYLVETPLQLLCAYEMMSPTHTNKLILRCSGVGRNDDQLIAAANCFELKHTTLAVRPKKYIIDSIKNTPTILNFLKNNYDSVYVGSYFSRFLMALARYANKKDQYLLDDGVATYLAQTEMKQLGKPQSIATFFNIPPLPGQKIIRHSFEKIRSRLIFSGHGGNYFIGQTLVDKGYLSISDYLEMIREAQCIQQDQEIHYIPHRAESDAVIEAVAKIPGISIKRMKTCVELGFILEKISPRNVFACFSSAIFSLSSLYPTSKIYSIIPSSINSTQSPHFLDILRGITELPNVSLVNKSSTKF